MNRTLLRKIAQNILDEPKRFDMSGWIEADRSTQRPTCGTACCIGGWAAVESGWKVVMKPDEDGNKEIWYISPEGEKSLGVGNLISAAEEALQISSTDAGRLFYTENWPDEFRYIAEDGDEIPIAKANNAADRIEHFINTGE